MQLAEFHENVRLILPEVALAVFALWALMLGVFKKQHAFATISAISAVFILGLGGTLLWSSFQQGLVPAEAFHGLYIQDVFGLSMKAFLCFGVVASILFVFHDMRSTQIGRFEAPVLMALSLLGMFFMISAQDMLMLYVGLELQSLALYVLASFNRHSHKAPEAGMKYFILGAIASGMMLFGISYVYGVTGHTGFTALGEMLSGEDMPAALILGLVLILVGMAFKISAVPFHMWTPDVYQGAPSSITAFFAIVPKLAAMCLLIRLLTGPFIALEEAWVQILYAMSIGSMVLGAFAGIVQKNIKRLLAYSSIGNIGYALVGMIAFGLDGLTGVVVYMVIYMFTSIGAFGVFLSLRINDGAMEDMDAYKGLARTHPFYAYTMAIFLFSLAGIPPLAGFFGKLLVFKAAVDQGFIILAVIGVLTSVVAAYYYIRLIKMMFFDSAERGLDSISVLECPVQRVVILLMAVISVGFCLMPSVLIDVAQNVSHHLFFDMKVVDPSIAADYSSVPEVMQEITE